MVNLVLSEALGRIAPSATIGVSQKARELKAAGEDVIALAAGEPDFPTPEHVAEAGIRAIREGHTGYTQADGIPALKEAVAAKFERDNALTYNPGGEVTITSGGKYVIFAAMMATLNPGDEVVVPSPYWVSYPDIVRLCGGEPIIAETKAEDGFRLTPEVLEAALTERTRWLILNSPSNPTGAVLSADDLKALGGVLKRHPEVMVLSDDIYEHITYDAVFATIASVVPELKPRVLTMNGASKAYSMTGWRIGFAAGPQKLIAGIGKLLSQTTSNPCSISQWAAAAALNGDHGFLEERRSAFRARRDHLLSVFAKAPGLETLCPEGAFYLYPGVRGLIGKRAGGRLMQNDLDIAAAILEQEKVALVPGAGFGSSPHLRLSYAASMGEIEEAAERILRFCEQAA